MASKTRTSSPLMKPIRFQMKSFPREPKSMILSQTLPEHPCPISSQCYMASDTIEAKFIADQLMEQGIPVIADRFEVASDSFRRSRW